MRGLFGERVRDLRTERVVHVLDRFATPDALVDYYRDNFGPTITAYAHVAGDPQRAAELDATFRDFAARSNSAPAGEPRALRDGVPARSTAVRA